MERFTPEQYQATARQYQQLSAAASRKRLSFIRKGVPLSDPTLIELESQQQRLGDISNEYALKAVTLTLACADQATAEISDSLVNAIAAMNTLKEIDKAISIASDAIDLSIRHLLRRL